MVLSAEGFNDRIALVDAKTMKKEDSVGTKFAHWSIDRPGTGQEIHRIGTCITRASNVFFIQNQLS